MSDDYRCAISANHAAVFKRWFAERGGVSVWELLALDSSQARQVFTPYRHESGEPMGAPHWVYGDTPNRVLVSPAAVEVEEIEVLQADVPFTPKANRRRVTEKWQRKYPNDEVYWTADTVVRVTGVTPLDRYDPAVSNNRSEHAQKT